MQKVKLLFTLILLFSLIGTAQAAGTDADIQKAIDDCTTGKVTLKADTYILSNPVILKSNIILTAEEGTIIKLKDHAKWKKFRGMFEAIGCENITVYGFEVDGNEPNQNEECGACYYTIFVFDGANDLVFHDLYLHDNCNDGIRVFNTESKDCNLEVYDCTFERTYHNGVYLHKANYAKIHDNKFIPRTNAGICATDSNGLDIHDNTIDTGTPPTGGAGMEIQKTTSINMDDIEIYNNIISNTNLPGIWLYGYNAYPADSAKDVYIHDNEITGCGMGRGTDRYYGGGLVVQGFNNTILENNVLTGNYNEGITLGNTYSNPPNYNYITVMKGNTISGTIASTYKSGKDLSVSSTYGYVSDGKIPEHDEAEDTTDDNKDGDGEGEDDVVIVPPEDNETDDNPDDDYYEPEPAREFEMDSIFDVFDMEFSENAYLTQDDVTPTIEWKDKGKYTRAWIDVPGYTGTIKIQNDTFIPSLPSECAMVIYDTDNTAKHSSGQESEVKLTDLEDNKLKVTLKVTTHYKVQVNKTITILGKKFKVKEWKNKKEKVTFTKIFDAPQTFPVMSIEDINVTVNYQNNSLNPHTTIDIKSKDCDDRFVTGAFFSYNESYAREYKLIGYAERQSNGFKITNFKPTKTWKFSDDTLSYSYQSLYIEGAFDINKLHVTVTTPYDTYEIKNFYYEESGNPFDKKINFALLVIILVLFVIARPFLIDLTSTFRRMR